MSLTVDTYARIGPPPARPGLEDEGLERMLNENNVPIDRLDGVHVTTSERTDGRAPRSLAQDLRVHSWLAERRYRAQDYSLGDLVARKDRSVSVVLPTRETASTIGSVLEVMAPLERAGLIDEILVVDAASSDGTAEVAERHGARVADESSLMSDFGPAQGKGDAMWRGLSATSGDIVAYFDTDTEDFNEGFVLGMLGPLLHDPELAFLKGAFRRPLRVGETLVPDGGGRVTELIARPYLNVHVPDLAGYVQPLAGEIAASRALLESLPFPVGYGVEIAMLIDAHRAVGLERMAQVDLGTRQNRHQSLASLTLMSVAVLAAAERRVHGPAALEAATPGPVLIPCEGDFVTRNVVLDERPPLATLTAGSSAAAAEA